MEAVETWCMPNSVVSIMNQVTIAIPDPAAERNTTGRKRKGILRLILLMAYRIWFKAIKKVEKLWNYKDLE